MCRFARFFALTLALALSLLPGCIRSHDSKPEATPDVTEQRQAIVQFNQATVAMVEAAGKAHSARMAVLMAASGDLEFSLAEIAGYALTPARLAATNDALEVSLRADAAWLASTATAVSAARNLQAKTGLLGGGSPVATAMRALGNANLESQFQASSLLGDFVDGVLEATGLADGYNSATNARTGPVAEKILTCTKDELRVINEALDLPLETPIDQCYNIFMRMKNVERMRAADAVFYALGDAAMNTPGNITPVDAQAHAQAFSDSARILAETAAKAEAGGLVTVMGGPGTSGMLEAVGFSDVAAATTEWVFQIADWSGQVDTSPYSIFTIFISRQTEENTLPPTDMDLSQAQLLLTDTTATPEQVMDAFVAVARDLVLNAGDLVASETLEDGSLAYWLPVALMVGEYAVDASGVSKLTVPDIGEALLLISGTGFVPIELWVDTTQATTVSYDPTDIDDFTGEEQRGQAADASAAEGGQLDVVFHDQHNDTQNQDLLDVHPTDLLDIAPPDSTQDLDALADAETGDGQTQPEAITVTVNNCGDVCAVGKEIVLYVGVPGAPQPLSLDVQCLPQASSLAWAADAGGTLFTVLLTVEKPGPHLLYFSATDGEGAGYQRELPLMFWDNNSWGLDVTFPQKAMKNHPVNLSVGCSNEMATFPASVGVTVITTNGASCLPALTYPDSVSGCPFDVTLNSPCKGAFKTEITFTDGSGKKLIRNGNTEFRDCYGPCTLGAPAFCNGDKVACFCQDSAPSPTWAGGPCSDPTHCLVNLPAGPACGPTNGTYPCLVGPCP